MHTYFKDKYCLAGMHVGRFNINPYTIQLTSRHSLVKPGMGRLQASAHPVS